MCGQIFDFLFYDLFSRLITTVFNFWSIIQYILMSRKQCTYIYDINIWNTCYTKDNIWGKNKTIIIVIVFFFSGKQLLSLLAGKPGKFAPFIKYWNVITVKNGPLQKFYKKYFWSRNWIFVNCPRFFLFLF